MFKLLLFLTILCQSCLLIYSKNEKLSKSKKNIVKNLFNAKSIEDLPKMGILMVKKPLGIHDGSAPKGRSGPISAEVKEATPGKCDPKPVCITNPLVANLSTTETAFPPCINIHRCDGCCPPNEKCVPVKKTDVKLKNVGIVNFGGEIQQFIPAIISVQNHTDCQCECLWETDEDCQKINPNFVKNPESCECICPEVLSCDSFHEFDAESCSCICKKRQFGYWEQNCKSRGHIWNAHACKCDTISITTVTKSVPIK